MASAVKRLFQTSSRAFSSYVHSAYHDIQSTIVSSLPQEQHTIYNEDAAKEWLSTYAGGRVELEMDQKSGVATILLDNIEKKNALTGKMMVDLANAVAQLEKWNEGRAVILKGVKGEFCSGGDLNFMSQIADPKSGAQMCIFMQNVTSRLLHLPLISVALIEGRALGGGAELTTACDFRLMHNDAKIGFVQSRLGITTGWGGGTHLTKHVGYKQALYLLGSAKVLSASEAESMKLVDHLITGRDEAALSECRKWLEPFTNGPGAAIKAFKRITLNAKECSYPEAMNRERDLFQQVWGGAAHKKAMGEIMKKS